MTQVLRSADRATLGLDDLELSEPFELSVHVGEVAEGTGIRTLVLSLAGMLQSGFAGVHFGRTSVPQAEHAGVQIEVCEEAPHILKVVLPSGTSSVRSLGEGAGAGYVFDAEDPDTIVIDTSKSGISALKSGNAQGLVIIPNANGKISYRLIVGRPIAVAAPAIVVAPLLEWSAACPDEWLKGVLIDCARSDSSWVQTATAGMLARLLEPDSSEAAGAALEAVMEQRPNSLLALLERPRRWARSLTPAQVATVQSFAITQCYRLHDELAELHKAAQNGSDAQDLLWLCHARDDLEGVRQLLTVIGAELSVSHELDALDEFGLEVMETLAVSSASNDERLRRAFLADPYAWWAEPVRGTSMGA